MTSEKNRNAVATTSATPVTGNRSRTGILGDNFTFPSTMIQRHMRSFDEMMNRMFRDDLNLMSNFDEMTPFNVTMASGEVTGFVERNGEYVYEVDIPKDMIDDVKISEKNRMIRISGKKEVIKEEKNSKSSSVRSFHKSVQIPPDAKADTAVAHYSHGKLEIVVKKN